MKYGVDKKPLSIFPFAHLKIHIKSIGHVFHKNAVDHFKQDTEMLLENFFPHPQPPDNLWISF